ncbi:hypothetical protein BDQ17DRAFT_1352934 [Cyathus striatus]|nr:hypothetical protein BDQ17DRAFT_1352934 [Cyathus striatus]
MQLRFPCVTSMREEDMAKSELTNSPSIKSVSDETALGVIDPKAEKKLLRKLDIVLLPMFTLIRGSTYFVYVLSRTNTLWFRLF